MNLHQLQVTYQPEEDRILFRLSFKDGDAPLQEVRTWLTRRLLKNLWPGILKSFRMQVTLDQPLAAHASDEIVRMEHQASLTAISARGDFDTSFETGTDAFPHGDTPVIITSVNIELGANRPAIVTFTASETMNFEVSFLKTEFHGFFMLLQNCIKRAEWDIGPLMAEAEDLDMQPRVLN